MNLKKLNKIGHRKIFWITKIIVFFIYLEIMENTIENSMENKSNNDIHKIDVFLIYILVSGCYFVN